MKAASPSYTRCSNQDWCFNASEPDCKFVKSSCISFAHGEFNAATSQSPLSSWIAQMSTWYCIACIAAAASYTITRSQMFASQLQCLQLQLLNLTNGTCERASFLSRLHRKFEAKQVANIMRDSILHASCFAQLPRHVSINGEL